MGSQGEVRPARKHHLQGFLSEVHKSINKHNKGDGDGQAYHYADPYYQKCTA